MGNIAKLSDLGCSVYHDGISRSLMGSGSFEKLIRLGVSGVTSNPVIFHDAISSGSEYDHQISDGVRDGLDAESLLWDLIVQDIRLAADLLVPVYRASQHVDGYVSVEVDPALANDAPGTLGAARALWTRVDRPNVMIKVPATSAGISCIEGLTFAGVNLNVTVVPTVESFESVFRAHAKGLADRLEAGLLPDVASVASLFLARIDGVVDQALDALPDDRTVAYADRASLKGKAGIATAKLAYQRYRSLVLAPEHQAVWSAGGSPQRLLWASVGPKDPLYPRLMYVENLVGRETVVTIPPRILDEFEEHGSVGQLTLEEGVDGARILWDRLNALGITSEFVAKGVRSIVLPVFAQAMEQLMNLAAERKALGVLAAGTGPAGSGARGK